MNSPSSPPPLTVMDCPRGKGRKRFGSNSIDECAARTFDALDVFEIKVNMCLEGSVADQVRPLAVVTGRNAGKCESTGFLHGKGARLCFFIM